MPRRPRRASSTGFYHVMNRGINNLPVFQGSSERTFVLRLLKDESDHYGVGIYAYCIMPDHYHFLVKADIGDLSTFTAVISAVYAQYYNHKKSRRGGVFHERFRSQCIEKEAQFWNCVRYLHQNPVNAGLCKDAAAYPYSSFREYVSGKRRCIGKEADVYRSFHFENKDAFRTFHWEKGTDWFADVAGDEALQKLDIAKIQLKKMTQNYKIAEEDLFEQARIRVEYEEELARMMDISIAEAKRLRKDLERLCREAKNKTGHIRMTGR